MDISQKQIESRPVVTPNYKRLRLGVIVSGRVVEETNYLPGKAVSIGTLPGNDIVIADSAHAPLSMLLFHYEGGDKCQLHLGKGMTARMSIAGQTKEIVAEDGNVSLNPSTDRGKVEIDDIVLLCQFVDQPEPRVNKQEPRRPERKGLLGKCFSALGG